MPRPCGACRGAMGIAGGRGAWKLVSRPRFLSQSRPADRHSGRTGALNARPSASRGRGPELVEETRMIRKLKDGRYRLYLRKKNPKTGKPRNLGTFKTRQAAEKHEREVQYFKRH